MENLEKIVNACNTDSSIRIDAKVNSTKDLLSFLIRNNPSVVVLSTNVTDLSPRKTIERIMSTNPRPVLLLQQTDDLNDYVGKFNFGIIDILKVNNVGANLNPNEFSITTRIHILSKLNLKKFKNNFEKVNLSWDNSPSRTKLWIDKKTKSDKDKAKLSRIEPLTKSNGNEYINSVENRKIIIIGSSTGGPRLLSKLIPKLPKHFPPVILIQHMPVGFISAFADRLNRLSQISVKEAVDDEYINSGFVYIAPGGKHLRLEITSNLSRPRIKLTEESPVNFVRPSVDVTLNSAVKIYHRNVISVILTGMGSDGKEGCRLVKENGGIVIALNEEDSDVYGMNKAVIEAGIVDNIFSADEIVKGITKAVEGKLIL